MMVRNSSACPPDISSFSNRDAFTLTTYRGRPRQMLKPNLHHVCLLPIVPVAKWRRAGPEKLVSTSNAWHTEFNCGSL